MNAGSKVVKKSDRSPYPAIYRVIEIVRDGSRDVAIVRDSHGTSHSVDVCRLRDLGEG